MGESWRTEPSGADSTGVRTERFDSGVFQVSEPCPPCEVAGIRHDLNNLLGALLCRIFLVQEDEACRASQGSNLETMTKIVESCAALVTKLPSNAHEDEGKRRPRSRARRPSRTR
jgi:hypothetical protein